MRPAPKAVEKFVPGADCPIQQYRISEISARCHLVEKAGMLFRVTFLAAAPTHPLTTLSIRRCPGSIYYINPDNKFLTWFPQEELGRRQISDEQMRRFEQYAADTLGVRTVCH
jgi:hypothetical protein